MPPLVSGGGVPVVTGSPEPITAMGGPCGWPIDLEACCDVPGGMEVAQVEVIIHAATEVLWAATGRQFGQCEVVLRPCRRECSDACGFLSYGATWPFPVKDGGRWINLGCGACGGECSCTSVSEVILPGPVDAIEEVVIDGDVLSEAAYRLDNGRILVRVDGAAWPTCQDLSEPAGAEGTWTVKAVYGSPVPPLGALALAELACEMVKACDNDDSCRLPQRTVQSINRQGVGIVLLDPQQFLDGGYLGLDLSDLFIRTYNPTHMAARSVVLSPDVPRPRRT